MSTAGGGAPGGGPGGNRWPGPGLPQPGLRPGPNVPPQGGWGPHPPGPPTPPPRPARRPGVLRYVFDPFRAAQAVFRPSRPGVVEDPTVRKLQLWRAVAGFAAWVWLTVTYSAISDAGKVTDVVFERFNQSWISVLVLICTFPVVVGAFCAAAGSGLRQTYLRRALRPLGAVAAVVASMFTFPLAMAPEFESFRDFTGIPGKVVISLLALWSLGFAIYGIGLSLVHVFRTADIHEVVPPVLATLLVWEMAIMDVATGAYGNVPPLARIAFMMGAPVTVTALAAWELHRLRRRHGLRLRTALRG
ncbi:hypothetical protein DB35_29255 [Streptomyces abyssalis]|uniref:Uncharacterized protein n=2 Tax=Streptomyces abyssalis TaxID=933944 RepID=A0A1E7JK14_9ACTN|nr:hypothetical protein [Streptomyces abyssalis]OEU85065.1 hypothetical protein DB35_29255 [Streptomyces abyssalis]OEU87987.1 hypothetical protein AN215_17290 [Streptomyces abyssalis]